MKKLINVVVMVSALFYANAILASEEGSVEYDPHRPVEDQVVKIDSRQETVDLFGIPYTMGFVKFKPIKVGDQIFDLVLNKKSKVRKDGEGRPCIYNKLTFTLKDSTGKSIEDEIETKDIDEVFRKLHDTVNAL